jgi:hypothetical protein
VTSAQTPEGKSWIIGGKVIKLGGLHLVQLEQVSLGSFQARIYWRDPQLDEYPRDHIPSLSTLQHQGSGW